jgi:heme/copper-type cytochrome/quinol oxidase subunit 3
MAVVTAAGPRREVVPASVLGVLLFVGTEVMFFAGLISAFTIARAGAEPGRWTLPTDPLLPAASTLANTAALLVSGGLLFVAHRQYRSGSKAAVQTLAAAWLLGAAFVVLQGREWWGLLSQGLTLWSGGLGAFFYLIVGAHGLHAVGALVALGVAWWRLRAGTLSTSFFLGTETFWYFVVGLWPIIYLRVYF